MNQNTQYLPILIVAKNSEGNFVHVRDADKDNSYTCPCCNSSVKIRAVNSKKIQPHFYHSDSNGCPEETIMHWLYKNWLFEQGCQFKVNDKIYKVQEVLIEKVFSTKYGNYIPDIHVTTESGKQFFFEINYSNKKNSLFADKWTELGVDVIEVDVKKLIYSSYSSSTPEFEPIFSEGRYVGKYETKNKKDIYINDIVVRKTIASENIERVCKLERFWQAVEQYHIDNIDSSELVSCVTHQSLDDSIWCYMLLTRLKCCRNDVLSMMAEQINKMIIIDALENNIDIIEDMPIKYSEKISSNRHLTISFYFTDVINQYSFIRVVEAKYVTQCNLVKVLRENIRCSLLVLKSYWDSYKSIKNKFSRYIGTGDLTITGEYYKTSESFDLEQPLSITIWSNIHNKWIKEPIGTIKKMSCRQLSVEIIETKKEQLVLHAIKNIDFELISAGYQNSSSVAEALLRINNRYSSSGYACRYHSGKNPHNEMGHWIIVQNGVTEITSINIDQFGCFDCGASLEKMISAIIVTHDAKYTQLLRLVGKINSSVNQFWNCSVEECATYLRLKIQVRNHPELYTYACINLATMRYEEQVYEIEKAMNYLFISRQWDTIRIMEVKNI